MASSNNAMQQRDLAAARPWPSTPSGSTGYTPGPSPAGDAHHHHQWAGTWHDSQANNSQNYTFNSSHANQNTHNTRATHHTHNTFNLWVDNSTHTNVNQRHDPRSYNVVNNVNSNNVSNSHNRRFDPNTHSIVQNTQVNGHEYRRHQNASNSGTQRHGGVEHNGQTNELAIHAPSRSGYLPSHASNTGAASSREPPSTTSPPSYASLPPSYTSRPPSYTLTEPVSVSSRTPTSSPRAAAQPSCATIKLRERAPAPKKTPARSSHRHKTKLDKKLEQGTICRVAGCENVHIHRRLQEAPRKVGGGFLFGWQKKWKESKPTRALSDFCKLHTCRGREFGRSGSFCQCPKYTGDRFCWCCAARENGGDVGRAPEGD